MVFQKLATERRQATSWTSDLFLVVVTEIQKQSGLLEGFFKLKLQNVHMQSKQFPYNIYKI